MEKQKSKKTLWVIMPYGIQTKAGVVKKLVTIVRKCFDHDRKLNKIIDSKILRI